LNEPSVNSCHILRFITSDSLPPSPLSPLPPVRSEAPPSPALSPSILPFPSSEPTPEESISSFTPEDIAASLLYIPLNTEGAARTEYYGKYVKWTGTIKEVNGDVIAWEFKIAKNEFPGRVHALLEREVAQSLVIGKKFTVICRVFSVARFPFEYYTILYLS
jgi:hypothetical protein